VIENNVLRRIFGPKKNYIIGGWGEMRNEELHTLKSPDSIRMVTSMQMRLARHVAHNGQKFV
jgi:hypothetical protein